MAQTNNAQTDSSKDGNPNSFRPTFLTVEVLGFGDGADGCASDDVTCRKGKNGGT